MLKHSLMSATAKHSKNQSMGTKKRGSVLDYNPKTLNLNNADNSVENCLENVRKFFKMKKITITPGSVTMKLLVQLVRERFELHMTMV